MESPEKFSSAAAAESESQSEGVREQKLETVDAVRVCLLERGWTKEQLGNFPSAVQAMADAMARSDEGIPAGQVHFELAITGDEEGEDVAEVTIMGEGKGLDPDQLSKLIEKGELFVKVFTQADPEFFADQNKVILRRKKNRAPEVDTDTIQTQ
jgi:hypothetical protein